MILTLNANSSYNSYEEPLHVERLIIVRAVLIRNRSNGAKFKKVQPSLKANLVGQISGSRLGLAYQTNKKATINVIVARG